MADCTPTNSAFLNGTQSNQDRVVEHADIFTLPYDFGLTIHFRLVKLNLKCWEH
jgi:hypothetical protein